MSLGIGKRDRRLLRADKVWRSIWHRQMLFAPQNSEAIDNPMGSRSYGVTNKSTATVGRSDTRNTGE